MSKKEALNNLKLLLTIGLPHTIGGMVVVFLGIYGIRYFFGNSEYQMVAIFIWLALFWFIYQPLFRKKIQSVKSKLSL